MAAGFRKSLMGFQCDDVIEYIQRTHTDFKNQQTELNRQIITLCDALKASKTEYQKLAAEKEALEAQVSTFVSKYDEIQRLSERVEKLYLATQSSAQSLAASAEESIKLSQDEISKNIASLDHAHSSLNHLKSALTNTSDSFSSQLEDLISSLDQTKAKISENTQSTLEKKDDFDALLKTLLSYR